MKVRPLIWAVSCLVLSVSFCIYRVNSQTPPVKQKTLTEAQRKRIKAIRDRFRQQRDHNYRARQNNGSKRGGLSPEQLPAILRDDAQEIARQYKNVIYPTLKSFLAKHGVLPTGPIPELLPYMQDIEYKGTGPVHYGRGSWAIGVSERMDGTMVIRDVYSTSLPDAPHDIWANHSKYANVPSLARGFIINGWDDGRVTFDRVDQYYYGTKATPSGNRPCAAAPGEAGIPATAVQGHPRS